jgi:SAM-dependent methyltransferase
MCHGCKWTVADCASDAHEIREGALTCESCNRVFLIERGIVDFLDRADEELRREIEGWHQMAGALPESLVATMTALPSYPHAPWPYVAADFFQIFEHVDFSGRRVVDLGAGRAWSTRFLATLGRAAEVVAVDVLKRRFLGLETADIFFLQDGIFFERLCADIHRLPLQDAWADVVFSSASIHHSSDPLRLFREVSRVLKPGGIFVFISEPVKMQSIKARQPENEETLLGINEHIYSFREYRDAWRAAGFRGRQLSPRSVRYRALYPDPDFQSGLPSWVLSLTEGRRRRRLLSRLLRGRWTGPLVYRYANLPLTCILTKRAR